MPDPLRLVLDTNVWLDWLVFFDPAVVRLRAAVQRGDAVVLMNAACRDELARVLAYTLRNRKAPLSPAEQAVALERALSHSSEPTPADQASALELPACADPDDQKFLELARDARAHVLVTRDRALLRLRRRRREPLPFRILPPPELVFPLNG
ncbi:MAG: putative toxin-antitoxin system toxin component, PIN family [Betaproteobacteria bacterium]|jgi:putative PIN family toxin of toxin-antitoxin system|nr:putative toxin-antitoxin system toxin component, PIN family [Rhodocyclaceae bacterium]MCA3133963.1 putative toxin-antitoxin system toxin component, PIN family [Rhodocyclaceae bacterium]MCA3142087.1 putative toxin-antitoxin system toxin component, PIN family [Rhodocyclaceae bacterium]MCA3147141.1 putative toxin-antitoxin system toxin component, PIN family [Rhodocyclaceae bacterium]MCE2898960.1 putative toxin-antitoxin system toxin component, PIN family [Betaproteobacteria bacterium]